MSVLPAETVTLRPRDHHDCETIPYRTRNRLVLGNKHFFWVPYRQHSVASVGGLSVVVSFFVGLPVFSWIRLYIMVLQNRPTKMDFWYFFTFVCCNACSVGDFTKSSNFVNHFCVSRSYKNRPHFCSTKLAYKKTNRPFTTAVLQFFGIIFLGGQPHRLTVDGSHVKKRPPKDGTQFFESKF